MGIFNCGFLVLRVIPLKMLPETQSWVGDSVSAEYIPFTFHLVSQALFLVTLWVCLCKVSAISRTKARAPISRESQNTIKKHFKETEADLNELVQEVETRRLEDGFLRFDTLTQDAEQKLFDHLIETRKKLSKPEADSSEVKQTLMCQFMENPQDIQGGRRLQTVLEIYKMCEDEKYSLGWWKEFKREHPV